MRTLEGAHNDMQVGEARAARCRNRCCDPNAPGEETTTAEKEEET